MARSIEKAHTFSDSGILLKDNVTLSVEKKVFSLKPLMLVCIAAIGTAGGIWSFLSFFDFSYDRNLLMMCCTFFFAVISLILNLPGKLKFLILPLCVLYETIFVRQRENFINGFKAIYNVIAQELNITGNGIMYYRIDSDINIQEVSTLFFIFAGFIYILLVCYATYCNVHFIAGIAITFLPVEVGLYFGLVPSYPAFIMTAAYWMAITAFGYSGCHDSSSNKDAGFIRLGNNFYAKAQIKFRVGEQTGLITAFITFAVISAAIVFTGFSGYKRPERVDEISNELSTAISEFSTENIPESLSRITSSFGNVTASPGKLGQHANLKFENEVNLQVSFDRKPESELYMKCFAGSYYTGREWDDFPNNTYDSYENLFSEFETSGIYPQDFISCFLHNINGSADFNAEINSLVKKPKFIYTPYGSYIQNLEKIKDTDVKSEDLKNYSLDFVYSGSYENFISGVQQADVRKSDTDFYQTAELEEKYRSFVYNEYLQLPENEAINQIREVYEGLISASGSMIEKGYMKTEKENSVSIIYNNKDVYKILCQIRSAISSNTQYTLSPGKTPPTRDFVNYFLFENQRGYCSHYATAGVVLARMCGIPARYAEGYIITESDLNSAVKDENGRYSVDVMDSRSHAWAEIYIDGFGWIPFEFTPGYESESVPFETTDAHMSMTVVMNETTVTETVTETYTETTETVITEAAGAVSESTAGTEVSEEYTDETTTPPDKPGTDIIGSVLKNNKFLTGAASVAVCILFILIILMLIFLIRRGHSIRKRRKSFSGASQNENAVNAYLYIVSLLEFAGIKNNNNMPYIDFAEYAEENTDFFKNGEFINATRTALKSDMSNHKISKNEAERVIKLAERLAVSMNEKSDRKQRFYLKYILNLS